MPTAKPACAIGSRRSEPSYAGLNSAAHKQKLITNPPADVQVKLQVPDNLDTWEDVSNYLERAYNISVGYVPGDGDFELVYFGASGDAGILWGESSIPEDEGDNPPFTGDDDGFPVVEMILHSKHRGMFRWAKIIEDAQIVPLGD